MLDSITRAYRDAYTERRFDFTCDIENASAMGSPELLLQMLDKLVDNAVDFSDSGDTISIGLSGVDDTLEVTVPNPGPPLPERMRSQMFDSMVSVRGSDNTRHLGLGLYVAKLIAEGQGDKLRTDNVDGGVCFTVTLPRSTP